MLPIYANLLARSQDASFFLSALSPPLDCTVHRSIHTVHIHLLAPGYTVQSPTAPSSSTPDRGLLALTLALSALSLSWAFAPSSFPASCLFRSFRQPPPRLAGSTTDLTKGQSQPCLLPHSHIPINSFCPALSLPVSSLLCLFLRPAAFAFCVIRRALPPPHFKIHFPPRSHPLYTVLYPARLSCLLSAVTAFTYPRGLHATSVSASCLPAHSSAAALLLFCSSALLLSSPAILSLSQPSRTHTTTTTTTPPQRPRLSVFSSSSFIRFSFWSSSLSPYLIRYDRNNTLRLHAYKKRPSAQANNRRRRPTITQKKAAVSSNRRPDHTHIWLSLDRISHTTDSAPSAHRLFFDFRPLLSPSIVFSHLASVKGGIFLLHTNINNGCRDNQVRGPLSYSISLRCCVYASWLLGCLFYLSAAWSSTASLGQSGRSTTWAESAERVPASARASMAIISRSACQI